MDLPTEVSPDIWTTLRSCELLSEASDASVAWLSKFASVRTYVKAERIFARTDFPREIGIVMRGHVRAVHFGTEGRPTTVLSAWPGEPIGLLAALSDDEYKTTYESAESDTAVIWFPRDAFDQLMHDEPHVMRTLITMLARQMGQMVTLVQTLSADVPARVAIYIGLLLEEQEPDGVGPFAVDLGVSRVELSALLGTVPETLSRAFHALQNDGIIDSRGRKVVVCDREALIARSNGVL